MMDEPHEGHSRPSAFALARKPSAFVPATFPDATPIVRPHILWESNGNLRKMHTNGQCRDTQRVLMFVDAWHHFGEDAPPNWSLTINLPSPIEFPETWGAKTVHEFVSGLLNPVGTDMKRRASPWRWVSVVEVKGGNYHVHALAYFPSRKTFLDVFFRVWKKVAMHERYDKSEFKARVFDRSSGTPLFATPVDPAQDYAGTGRFGAEGFADYMVKNLGKMTRRRRFSREVGAPTFISSEVNRLVAKKKFCVRSLEYSPARSKELGEPNAW